MKPLAPILYCRCAYAKVVPPEAKDAVLESLIASGQPFEAVADLCRLSAARDPALARFASQDGLRIVACYARAVRSLFAAAGATLPDDGIAILNMRETPAADIIAQLRAEGATQS